MKFSYNEVNQLPFVIVDDFYDNRQQSVIMQELLFLNNDSRKLLDPKDTGSAWTADENAEDGKVYLKKNKAIHLDDVYLGNRNISNILTENRKIFSDEVCDEIIKNHTMFRYLRYANRDTTLVSYYENSDYYLPHRDDSTLTALTWFYKEPKSFFGGDLILEESVKINCVNNRCVIFPSIMLHSVTEIQLDNNKKNTNNGRFTISQFVSYNL